ncbi:hypothetical protein EAF00_008916 [Botryotinia globosa]|nr:hypothetical protein EAF00_008916 [Botryotinia globosa]
MIQSSLQSTQSILLIVLNFKIRRDSHPFPITLGEREQRLPDTPDFSDHKSCQSDHLTQWPIKNEDLYLLNIGVGNGKGSNKSDKAPSKNPDASIRMSIRPYSNIAEFNASP